MSLKTVILAGGYGTRLSEETAVRPKPMVEIGERPILWHIMKGYEAHGVREFVICCGYKSHVIKDYFANYALRHADVTVDLAGNELQLEARGVEPWRVHLIETGDATMTGGRLRRVAPGLGRAGLASPPRRDRRSVGVAGTRDAGDGLMTRGRR